jgi:hypothetical protein
MHTICKHFYQYCIHISLYCMAIVLTVLYIYSCVGYDQTPLECFDQTLAYKPSFMWDCWRRQSYIFLQLNQIAI